MANPNSDPVAGITVQMAHSSHDPNPNSNPAEGIAVGDGTGDGTLEMAQLLEVWVMVMVTVRARMAQLLEVCLGLGLGGPITGGVSTRRWYNPITGGMLDDGITACQMKYAR